MARTKRPRAAETYRGERRNACLRGEPKGAWGPQHYYVKHDARDLSEPYMIKPPVIRFDWSNLTLDPPQSPLVQFRPRKQPKLYRANERILRRMAAAPA